MLLTKLLHALHAFSPRYQHGRLAGAEVFAWQPLAPGLSQGENILLVGTLSGAEKLLDEMPELAGRPLLCIEDKALARDFERLILVDGDTEPAALAGAVAEALAREAQLGQGMQRLIAAFNTGRGLQHIVDEAYAVLKNPISVIDISYRILALSTEGFEDRPDIEEQRESGYLMPENLAELRDDGVYRKLRETKYPYRTRQKRFDMPWLHTLVFIGGVEVASISLMERNSAITKEDIELFHFLSELVSMELQKSDFFKQNRGFMHSFLLSELLEGQIVDTSVLDMRLAQLDWKPTRNMYVLVLTGRQGTLPGEQMDLVARQVHELLPGARWAIYERAIVFLLGLPDENEDFPEYGTRLREYLEASGFIALVSDRFSNLLGMREQYKKALIAGEIGRRLGESTPVYYYPGYHVYHLGTLLEANGNLRDYLHPAVPRIAEYDKAHGTKLMETLETHLTHMDNPTKAAAALFIHRNTLFYRVAKIREQFRVDLSNGDERLQIQLSLKFYKLLEK